MMKLAIIGASSGQLPLCLKAKEMGLETHCFAWLEGAVCKDIVDYYYPISIAEKDRIVDKCREIKVDGVVSNASDLTAEVVSYVSDQLGLIGIPYKLITNIHNKLYVRQLSESVRSLSKLKFYKYEGVDMKIYPCVIKPCEGSAKNGVSFANNRDEFDIAIKYALEATKQGIIVEEYIDGKELSVECISYNGKHQVIQVTDKDSSGAPHFVELGHHLPANITASLKRKIEKTIPELLNVIGFINGASHIEIKYKGEDIYLIEINPRGGGGCISNQLVQMSSGIDYLRCIIEVALGTYESPTHVSIPSYAGIYFLCKQTKHLLPFFENAKNEEWFVEEKIANRNLRESLSNYDRDGYLIYKSDHKIKP